jgi:hypothetical protein
MMDKFSRLENFFPIPGNFQMVIFIILSSLGFSVPSSTASDQGDPHGRRYAGWGGQQ